MGAFAAFWLLRMSMPSSVAIREVIPRLAPFLVRHPELRMQVLLGDRPQDLVKDAVDVAIRLGRLADSTATATLITKIPRVIVASRGYIELNGAPATPDALTQHRIVGGPASVVPTAWKFKRAGEEIIVDLEPHFSTNENEGAVAAATAGLGITSTSEWACRRELAEGSLVRLLVDWKTADIQCTPTFRWDGRLAPRDARSWHTSLPISDASRSPLPEAQSFHCYESAGWSIADQVFAASSSMHPIHKR
jgi:DNA-binding transcriptional LysR family regulator